MSAFDLETCFRIHRARVYRWAYALCGRHADALDVVQEVFLKMAQQPPPLENPAAAGAWLRRVTARLVIDRWRAERARDAREQHHAAPRPAAGHRLPPERLEAEERAARVRAALADLSEQQRLVVLCKHYDQMTFQQIAAELGVAVPTVKTHYLRALEAVREHLKPDVEIGRLP